MSEGTLRKLLAPSFSFLTWGNWRPVSLKCFPSNSEVTWWQSCHLKPGSRTLSASQSGLSLAVATVFLTCLSSSVRFFRNRARNSSTSWLLSPSASPARWLSSSRPRKPWKVGRTLAPSEVSELSTGSVQQTEQRNRTASPGPRETVRYFFFFLNKWE